MFFKSCNTKYTFVIMLNVKWELRFFMELNIYVVKRLANARGETWTDGSEDVGDVMHRLNVIQFPDQCPESKTWLISFYSITYTAYTCSLLRIGNLVHGLWTLPHQRMYVTQFLSNQIMKNEFLTYNMSTHHQGTFGEGVVVKSYHVREETRCYDVNQPGKWSQIWFLLLIDCWKSSIVDPSTERNDDNQHKTSNPQSECTKYNKPQLIIHCAQCSLINKSI